MKGATEYTLQFIPSLTNPFIQPYQLLELSCLINKTVITFATAIKQMDDSIKSIVTQVTDQNINIKKQIHRNLVMCLN